MTMCGPISRQLKLRDKLLFADHTKLRKLMWENNSELWNLFPELLNCFCLYLIIFPFTHFCVELFSGRDEVRTSNLRPFASVMGLSAFRSHAPTTQSPRRLKTYQLLIIQHPKLTIISFFLFSNLSCSVHTQSAVYWLLEFEVPATQP